MRIRFWYWAGLAALLLAAGCRGNGVALSGSPSQPAPGSGAAGAVRLTLDAKQEAGDYRLILSAAQASDLYQLAGTLLYDPTRYDMVRVEAGGALGDPLHSYLFDAEKDPGHHAFAYTKRYAGPGASGAANLVDFIVTPKQGKFSLGDFKLDTSQGQLRVRDSKKHDFSVTLTPGKVLP